MRISVEIQYRSNADALSVAEGTSGSDRYCGGRAGGSALSLPQGMFERDWPGIQELPISFHTRWTASDMGRGGTSN